MASSLVHAQTSSSCFSLTFLLLSVAAVLLLPMADVGGDSAAARHAAACSAARAGSGRAAACGRLVESLAVCLIMHLSNTGAAGEEGTPALVYAWGCMGLHEAA